MTTIRQAFFIGVAASLVASILHAGLGDIPLDFRHQNLAGIVAGVFLMATVIASIIYNKKAEERPDSWMSKLLKRAEDLRILTLSQVVLAGLGVFLLVSVGFLGEKEANSMQAKPGLRVPRNLTHIVFDRFEVWPGDCSLDTLSTGESLATCHLKLKSKGGDVPLSLLGETSVYAAHARGGSRHRISIASAVDLEHPFIDSTSAAEFLLEEGVEVVCRMEFRGIRETPVVLEKLAVYLHEGDPENLEGLNKFEIQNADETQTID